MKIVADANIPYVAEAFDRLGTVSVIPGRQINASHVRDAALLLVRSVTRVDQDLLQGSTVRFVATATIGTDHLDREYLARQGIGLASAAGCNANAVAEYVIAALLELGQRHGFRLRKQVLGVVGVGNVGRRVEQFARALGMEVLLNDPPRQRVEGGSAWMPLSTVLEESDILTLHVPLTRHGADATYHLLGSEQLKPFYLVNTARGDVVDPRALLAALQSGVLPGAVLDVWEQEPAIDRELLEQVDLGTPHIAGYSLDGKVNGTRQIYQAACAYLGVRPTWEPSLDPSPCPAVELVVGRQEDDENAIHRLVSQVYDLARDDASLRQEPSRFDDLRAHYPVRREFGHTTVQVSGGSTALRHQLAVLGFKVKQD